MVEITDEEGGNICAEEQDRVFVLEENSDSEAHEDHWLREKLVAPGVIVLLTAISVGVVAPYVLQVDADQKHTVELKSALIEELVTESSLGQTAALRYQEQLSAGWARTLS